MRKCVAPAGGDLRQVRDAQHLEALAQRRAASARPRSPRARRCRRRPRRRSGSCPPGLGVRPPASSAPASPATARRPRRCAPAGGAPRRGWATGRTRPASMPRSDHCVLARRADASRTSNARPLHGQLGQLRSSARAKPLGRPLAPGGKRRARRQERRRRPAAAPPRRSARLAVPPVSAACSAARASRRAITSSSAGPCLRLSRSSSASRSSTSWSRAGDASMLAPKVAERERQVLELRLDAVPLLRGTARTAGRSAASSPTRFHTLVQAAPAPRARRRTARRSSPAHSRWMRIGAAQDLPLRRRAPRLLRR